MGMTQGFLFGFIVASCFLASIAQQKECQDKTLAFDIVFLMDSSSSIAVREFRDMKAFVRNVVKGMDIDSKNVQVGLVQFSIDPHKEILLGDYANKADLFQKIDKIPLRQGGTFMGKAMTFLKESYFTSAGGSRIDQKVPQIIVVVTDGDSADDIKAPAEALRAKGIIIFAIGVGETNSTQMRSIASSPPERFVVNIENYEALKELTTTMMQTVCVLMKDQGKAIAQKFADVFVLVDSSATTKKQEIRDILTQLAVNLKVGDGSNKIALAQFGGTVVKEFLFSDYMDTAKAKEYITRFEPRPKGDRKLGNALDYVRNNFLNTESGSRISAGYKQYILLLRVGESSDSVLGATRRMKNEDVTVIDGRLEINLRLLTPVISGYDFQQDITQIATDITEIIETEEVLNVTGDCKLAQVADIVFIVDESASIEAENFDLMRQFLHRIVSGLVVEPESVRVGLVLYSDKPSAGFFLDSFGNKNDILNYIKILPYRGGGTETGAALTFAKDNLFTPTRGSRKALGIKQIAIIITDGKSQDDVTDAAAKLRRSGVTVYAVGVKDASSEELLKIASYPQKQFVFNVESFQMLTPLEKSLSKRLCKDVVNRRFDKDKKHTLKQACVNTEEADIYFLLDTSAGTRADFEDVKDFILFLLKLFTIGQYRVRAGIVKADRTPTLQFSVNDHKTRETLEKDVRNMLQPSGGPEMGVALTYVAERFREANVSRKANVQNILIIITDKKSQDDVSDPIAELSNLGVLVYAVGVGDADQDYLLKMADDSKVFFVTNYDALNVIKTDVLTDICSQEACRSQVADIMFLIDGSTSIAMEDFISMKTFINKLVNGSVIGRDDVHIGVVQFSSDPQEQFPLNRFYDKTKLQEEIDNIVQLTGNTYTGQALSFVSPYFDVGRGGRPGISQFLIVITDGVAHDGEVAATNAKAIRDKGVVIYSIGVGSVDTSQLLSISGSADKVYLEKDFDGIQTLDKDLQFKMCYTVTDCQKELLADVIFLVQCTSQIRSPEIQKNILNFLISVVNSTQISDNLIRIGVIVYSDTPSQFTLNQYSSKHQVLDSIKNLRYSNGNANTAKALEYSLAYFNEERGGRQKRGIPQMLYLITDGQARDKNNLKARADEYAAKHIQVYGIGVANAKRSELEIITKNKNNVFQVDNYKALQGLQNNISGTLCNMSKPECQNEVADLVFLIDGSESIKEDQWKTMIAFLLDLVDKLRVTRDLFRIGVAQFSTRYIKEFYLNEHEDAKGVKSAIQQITQIKEGTKIGAALRNVVEFFQESKGSRKQNGVPQNLVLITDGDSSDDVTAAADALRNMNINIFAIGIGDISMSQLSYIAGSPDRLFLVENFDSLNLRAATFVDALCTNYPSNSPSCSIDIAIGFDISTTSSSSPSIFKSQDRLRFSLHEIVRDVSVVHNLCCATEPTINNNIGFRLVSADGQKLNDYMFGGYSEDVFNKVVGLQNPQALKFNSRLLGSFEDMFKASNSYIKVLIIFTDGLDEPVEQLLDAAEKLRKSGVHALLTVALDGFRNTADLQRLEFGRGFGYKQLLSIGMQNVAGVMQKEIDTVASRLCCNVLCKCSGNQGVHGPYGRPGLKGLPGQKGSPGFPGDEGEVGKRGPPGLNGTQGYQGCHGRSGIKGGRGYRGEHGDAGEDGLNGVDGEQGVVGGAGSLGERGFPGSPGPRGISGDPGVPGQKGLRGDPGNSGLDNNSSGPKGDVGSPGVQGEPGPDGFVGEAGDPGRPGLNGRRGSVGQPGPRGPPGESGPEGPPGASGPLGAFGQQGPVGQRGFLGLPGPQGSPGSLGRPGSKGSLGSRGQKGQPGDPGDKGALGLPGARGLQGIDGADVYGFSGPKGQKGDTGFPGYSGLQGERGDTGINGGVGPKGNGGRGGNAGRAGPPGDPGSQGMPGHRGPRGPVGTRQMSDCPLISYVRDNCLCCKDKPKCPAYPTDLVIGLDMSGDVTPQAFERMRSTVLTLLDNINVVESNCPTGARVAVVSYNSYTKYLIRFTDYHRKQELIQAIQRIALKTSTSRRNIGSAMRFVGRNMFKRVRKATLMRKVAIFLSNGESQDTTSLTTAILEYKALNINLGVIGLKNVPSIRRAFEADESQSFIFTVLGARDNQKASLSKIQNCVICFDPCRPDKECDGTNLQPSSQELDLDLAVIVDGSRSILADQYEGVKEVLGSVLDQIVVSNQPSRADGQARVALYQQSSTYSEAQSGVKVIFNFQQFQDHSLMKRSIHQELKQTGGSARLGLAMEYAIMQSILTAPKARKNKMVLAIVGEQTAYHDRAKLDFISRLAKCEGVVLFTMTVGDHFNNTQVEEMASYPLEQHIIRLGQLKDGEQEYARRFLRTFFHILSKNTNSYPPPSLQKECSNFQGQTSDFQPAERPVHRVPFPATPSPTANVEQETEETEDLQSSGRGDSLRLAEHEGKPELPMQKEETTIYDDACLMKQDVGPCSQYVLKWFYDIQQNECVYFWFGGCEGNKNRFDTQEQCEALCLQIT